MPTYFPNRLVNTRVRPTHKTTVRAADITGTTLTLTGDPLAQGDVVTDVYVNVVTPVVQTSSTAITMTVGFTGTAAAFVTTACEVLASGYAQWYRGVGTLNGGTGIATAVTGLLLTFAATGGTMGTGTSAGQIDIYYTHIPATEFFY